MNFFQYGNLPHTDIGMKAPKVLLLEDIHSKAALKLEQSGFEVEREGNLSEKELCERIKGVEILGIRSKSHITPSVIASADRLTCIGTFCVGVDQVDLERCSERGIAVFNAPYSNTRSVVELTIAEIILLARDIPDKFAQMHQGRWNKSNKRSHEVRGKTLGIIGYGNIGSQLSVLAESIGMRVLFYDIAEKQSLGNAVRCLSMQELLENSDVVSIHIDGRPENKKFISRPEFEMMKQGVVFLNLSRGCVVDIEVIPEFIKSGKIKGVGLDVFPSEPKENGEFLSSLQNCPNVILTPHVGGSTYEAQQNIAEYVPQKLISYYFEGTTIKCVNLPEVMLPSRKGAQRIVHFPLQSPRSSFRSSQGSFGAKCQHCRPGARDSR